MSFHHALPSRTRARRLVGSLSLFALVVAAGCSVGSEPTRAVGVAKSALVTNLGNGNGSAGAGEVTTPGTVVNAYATIAGNVTQGDNVIPIANPTDAAAFAVGKLVLLWQTTGLGIADATSGSGTPIDLTTSGVGSYEFGRIAAVDGANITLSEAITNATGFRANTSQIVVVPEYTDLRIEAGASITATAWNGGLGGIVAFLVNGTFSNEGLVDASSRGFRAGFDPRRGSTAQGVDVLDADPSTTHVAGKGEGLVPARFSALSTGTNTGGYGNVSVGGGGGCGENAGGGGGGNGGRGGQGGRSWDNGRDVGGRGGVTVYATTPVLTLGGGGGGGEGNNNTDTPGAVGGGVVFLRASAYEQRAADAAILANGTGQTLTAGGDGAGGGGAGGSLHVELGTLVRGCPTLSAIGGRGGDLSNAGCHGDGGGGGGGRAWVSVTRRFDTCVAAVTPGRAGLRSGVQSCGSTAGAAGPSANGVAPAAGEACVDGASLGCIALVCSNTDGLCGLPNSGACTSDAACRAGVCHTDGRCGLPNGDALPGGGAPPAASCRSGVVGSNGRCGLVQGEGHCAADVACQSGFCHAADGLCGLPNGATCTTATESVCRSRICNANGTCGQPNGATCTSGLTCLSGACSGGTCAPTCTTDAQCASTSWCDATSGACEPDAANGEQPGGANCVRSSQCLSNVCDADGRCGTPDGGTCSASGACRGASGCVGEVCGATCPSDDATGDAACAVTAHCDGASCVADLPNGVACTRHGVCASHLCNPVDGLCGSTTNQPCDGPAQCRSGVCSATTGLCLDACATDAECAADAWCNAGTCTPDGANGAAPAPAPSCARAAQCVSAVCGGDGLCGGPFGHACGDGPTLCRATVCSPADNGCGYGNGTGPCTTANAATVCRSGLCFTDALCGLPLDEACTGNEDCRSGLCAASNTCAACTSDTECGAATSGRVCDGGSCVAGCRGRGGNACPSGQSCTSQDTSIGDCATTPPPPVQCREDADCATNEHCDAGSCATKKPNGAPCEAEEECASNVCDVDGACGVADGNACGSNGACRSGTCRDGVCAPETDPGDVDAERTRSLEGGGLNCSTGAGSANGGGIASLALLGAVFGGLRRRKTRATTRR